MTSDREIIEQARTTQPAAADVQAFGYQGAVAKMTLDLLRRAGIGEPAGLVWKEYDGDTYIAETTFASANYEVCRSIDGPGWYAYLNGTGTVEIGDTHPTPEAARAACEADCAARALTMWPVLAGEIERLRADNGQLREALEFYADLEANSYDLTMDLTAGPVEWRGEILIDAGDIARAALAAPPAPVVASPQETTAVDDSESPSGSDNVSAEAIRAEIACAGLRAEVERRETDIRILLAQLDYLREVTGEGVEEEDAALVEEIRASLPTLSPRPADKEGA